LFRVFGPDKKPLPAIFRQSSPEQAEFETDEFGRALITGVLGSIISGDLLACNASPKKISLKCSSDEPLEQEVVLDKA
jgi:hypothetical protein